MPVRRGCVLSDLSRVVSKYIGETEKHLELVFQAAEQRGGVFVFDEADARFGKRSEVKDAHDRYANVEVAFLLQRTESFAGLAILTTNSRQNIDATFLRRLRFVVDFSQPNVNDGKTIWENGPPDKAPVEGTIDWLPLARFDLRGGVVRQVMRREVFIAASAQRERSAWQGALIHRRCTLHRQPVGATSLTGSHQRSVSSPDPHGRALVMNWDEVGAIGQVLGSIAVFITLGYLAMQTNHARREVQRAISQSRDFSAQVPIDVESGPGRTFDWHLRRVVGE